MRIVGLSSGMDIDKIVSDLMKAEKIPQDSLKQKKELLNFQTSLYREVNTKIASLREALNSLRFGSGLSGMKATASNTNVTVSSTGPSSKASYSIKVNELATPATTSGEGGVSNYGLSGENYSETSIVQGVNDQFIVTIDNQAKAITLKPGNYTIDEMKTELQEQFDTQFGKNKLSVTVKDGSRFAIESVTTSNNKPQVILNEMNGGTALDTLGFADGQSYRINLNAKLDDLALSGKFDSTEVLQGSGEFTVNGASIKYDENDTLQSIMTKVNTSSAGVTMSYDAVNNKFMLKSRSSGASSEISIENTSGNLLTMLKIPVGTSSGSDARVTIDGEEKTFASNSISYDGLSIQLNKASTEETTVTVAGDADAVIDKVKKFVDTYNELMDLVNTRLSETRDRSYNPLTDEEKSAMKDTDVTNWENKVKEGLLTNSPILKNIKNSLRELLSKQVDGIVDEFNTLSEIGITTAPYVRGVSKDAGKIVVDETKLRAAVEGNPEAVSMLFTNNPGFESQEGIAVTMYNRVNDLMSSLMQQAGRVEGARNDRNTTLGKQIYDLEDKIQIMTTLLSKKEDNYFKRFSVMEQAIEKGNAQLAWLSQQLG